MKNLFYVAKNSAKYIIRANIDNKVFKDNCVIAHCYPNKQGFLIYLHENAIALDNNYTDNPRYIAHAKNEKFAKRFVIPVNRENCKTDKQIEALDKKTVNALMNELNERAHALENENA